MKILTDKIDIFTHKTRNKNTLIFNFSIRVKPALNLLIM